MGETGTESVMVRYGTCRRNSQLSSNWIKKLTTQSTSRANEGRRVGRVDERAASQTYNRPVAFMFLKLELSVWLAIAIPHLLFFLF